MADLSIIYLTKNLLPKHWKSYQWQTLISATEGYKILRVSPEQSADIIDTEIASHLNMYRQLLKACKMVTTPYIATAEDDVLYSKEHFNFYRPPMDTIAYDMARWTLFTWGEPVYSIKQRISNCTLIAPREFYIDRLEAKLSKIHDNNLYYVSEVGRYERQLGLEPTKVEKVYATVPSIHINHPESTDPLAKEHRKRQGQIKAYDIPFWGKAADIIKEYR